MLRNLSIQRKLLLIIIVAGTLPLLLTSSILIGYEFFDARSRLANELTTLADVTGWNSTAAVVFRDKASAERMLAGLRAEPHVMGACIYDQRGDLLAAYRRRSQGAPCESRTPGVGIAFDRQGVRLSRAILLDDEWIGTVLIHSDLDALYARLRGYATINGFILLGGLVLAFVLSLVLQTIVSNPILELARVARIVTERKDYSVRAERGADDELGQLVGAFNAMLARLGAHASELTNMNRELVISKQATERAAAALVRSEKRFRATFDEAPIGMNLMDAECRVVESNHALQNMLGYTREELYSMTMEDITHPDDIDRDRMRYQELVAGHCPRYRVEKRYFSKDGRTVWAQLTVSRLHMEGGEFLAIGMAENITERKQLEEQFRQAQKMEAIGRLAGGVAHDFNNLLTVIKGNTELSMRRLAPDHPMRRNLGQVQKAADRAAALVDQLLAFSRKQLIDPKVLDLNVILRDLEKMLRRLIGEDIELLVRPGEGRAWIHADAVQIEQIVFNLVVNARDAMPQGGRLTITTAGVRLETAPPDNPGMRPGSYVMLVVADTGIGIGEDVRSHIFEPFFTTKEVGKGTGLGLSTVYGIVQQASGTITVDSKPGHGARFTIYFPRVEQAEPEPGAEVAPRLPGRSAETVLVVEDETLVRAIICETLRQQGHTILEAQSGDHALRVASEYQAPIHLLLTDVVMPRMTGIELAEKLAPRRPQMKVLYISGYTEKSESLNAPFLRKPFTPGDLAAKIRAILDDGAAKGQPAG